MKNLIIAIVLALAYYTLAQFLNGKSELLQVAPMQAAIFAGIGAYSALLISHGMHR